MNITLICYKLVRRHRYEYVSINPYCRLIYRIGQTTRSDYGGLYVFTSLSDARHYFDKFYASCILKCECGRIRMVPNILSSFDWKDVEQLFKRRKWYMNMILDNKSLELSDKKWETTKWIRLLETVKNRKRII